MISAPHISLRQSNKSFRHSIPQNFLYEGVLQLYKKHLVIPFIAVSTHPIVQKIGLPLERSQYYLRPIRIRKQMIDP